jgi:hypothetical protein
MFKRWLLHTDDDDGDDDDDDDDDDGHTGTYISVGVVWTVKLA